MTLPFTGEGRAVTALAIDLGWTSGFAPSCDLAVLRLDAPGPEALSTEQDFGADLRPHQVALYGYDFETSEGNLFRGTVRRIGRADGHDVLESEDITVPSGYSGSPFVVARNSQVAVVGVATWDATGAAAAFKGLPLLTATFGQLLGSL